MTDLVIRIIQPKQADILVDLWNACFPSDPPTFAAQFIQNLPQNAVFVVGELANVPVTMACLIPAAARFRNQNYAVRYLYAGCTHPKERGKGYYRQLMDAAHNWVQEIGEYAIYLRPASEPLDKAYRRMGYQPGISGGTSGSFTTAPAVSLNVYLSQRPLILDCLAQETVVWDPASEITEFFFQDIEDVSLYADTSEGLVLRDAVCLEHLSLRSINDNASFCLWIPTNASLLQQNMHMYGGITGIVGD